jgi:hypothetical protein
MAAPDATPRETSVPVSDLLKLRNVVADKCRALRDPTTAKLPREATDADTLHTVLAEPSVG